jgi:hypothetical protein
MLLALIVDAVFYLGLCLRPNTTLAAENLFLRKQLALYQEPQVKPRQATNSIRLAMVWLSRWFDWRSAFSIVKPETFVRWHRQGFNWFWRYKSRSVRPALPKDLQALIRRMTLENPIWGQERIANELLLKLGLRISPRTVCKYMPDHCVGGPGKRCQTQRWSTFMIPLNDKHLYGMLKEWVAHYNKVRPHMSLGPGIPGPIRTLPVPRQAHRHWMPTGQRILARPILSGLHHDYQLQPQAA